MQLFPYIKTAVNLAKKNLTIFRCAVEKRFSSEQEFKSLLCHIGKQGNNVYRTAFAELYVTFGYVTSDLIDMVLDINSEGSNYLFDKIEELIDGKQTLLDRDTIESLYAALKLPSRRSSATRLLSCLVHAGFLSVLEVF
ncbi:hypothetical protein I4U23_004347 [Adineta vaga]|nr:hypothetical protein I4U23_004347 [Adineta vaga]